MADGIKVSELDEIVSLNDDDTLYAVQAGVSKRIQKQNTGFATTAELDTKLSKDEGLATVDTLAELQAVDTAALVDGSTLRVIESDTDLSDGFDVVWRTGDQSALYDEEPWRYVVPDSDTSGASGLWERDPQKDIKARTNSASVASLPRFIRKLEQYNEASAPTINITCLGSSVGNGATLPTPSTQAPVQKFGQRIEEKLNKLGTINFNTTNYSVNGSTLSGGVLTDFDLMLSGLGTSPDLLLLAYGMNDSAASLYNTGQTYPFVYTNTVELVRRARENDCDVVIMTTPHVHTERSATTSFALNATLRCLYPEASFIHTGSSDISFTAATNRIDAPTGKFTNPAFGFGIEVGRVINVSGTVSNNGDYTIASVDPSGDFITVLESLVDESNTSATIKRIAIQGEELTPTTANSAPIVDAIGDGRTIPISHRHYRVNQAMRRAAVDLGVPLIDVEYYWFKAVAENGQDALFNAGEFNHPNLLGHQLSYWQAIYDFVDSLSESYQSPVQQNTLIVDRLGINDTLPDATLSVKQKNSSDDILSAKDTDGVEKVGVSSLGEMTLTEKLTTARDVDHFIGGSSNCNERRGNFLNRPAASSNTIPTETNNGGIVRITARQAGIGTQFELVAWANQAGTASVSSAGGVGPTVVNVTASGADIVITPVANNTNIHWEKTAVGNSI